MVDLKIINQNNQLVTDSRDVAKLIGKNHHHLIRDIERYINILEHNPNLDSAKFFLRASYTDPNNRERPCYLLTKKGCEMVANKMTGEKGVLFTAAYVDRFNEMEQSLKGNQTDSTLSKEIQFMNSVVKAFTHVQEDVKLLKADVEELREIRTLGREENREIESIAKDRIVELLGGKDKAMLYQSFYRTFFRNLWVDFHKHFNVRFHADIKLSQFDEASSFIKKWEPDIHLLLKSVKKQK